MPERESLKNLLGSENPSEILRETLRVRALQSTYLFGKAVLGFRDLTPDLHGEMARWIQRPSPNRVGGMGDRKLGLVPRDHLKTSIWTIADKLRRVTADPNLRVLILNEVEQNPINWVLKMERVVMENPLYRWLYPQVIPDPAQVRWSRLEMELKRTDMHPEATMTAAGVGTSSTSQHYNIIQEDDLVGKEASESPPVMLKAIGQHKLAESLLDSPGGHIHTIGTRWGVQDLARWMLEHEEGLDFFRLSCRRPDGQPIWPQRFTQEYLVELRKKYGAALFARQYENDTIAEGITELPVAWLRYYTFVELEGKPAVQLDGGRRYLLSDLERFSMVDPGLTSGRDAGQSSRARARTAVVTVGLTPAQPFDVVILSARAQHTTPLELLTFVWEEYQRWDPLVVGIETAVAQITFFYWIPTVYPNLPLRKLKGDTHRSKETRIRSVLATLGEQRRIVIHRSMVDFIGEWESFPSGQTVDLLDALAYGPQIWAPPIMEDEELEEGEEEWAAANRWTIGRSPVTGY